MLNVHVKLTGALADAARRSAGQLQEHLSGPDGERVGDVDLARGAHEPHVTLYMAEFREDQLAPLLDAVRATCAEVRAPEVRLGARVARGTYAFWECAPSDELVALSALLALRCARFVARERVERPTWFDHIAPARRELAEANLRLFGSAGVGDLYDPHVTLANAPGADAVGAAVAALGGAEPAAFRAETVDVGRVGPGGTVLSGEDVASIAVTGSKPATLACMSAQQSEILRLRRDEEATAPR